MRHVSQQVKAELIAKAGGRCSLCGRATTFLAIDHILPVAKGGTESPENLQVLCASCNIRKADKAITDLPTLRRDVEEAYHFERQVAVMLTAAGFGVLSNATGPDAGVDLVVRKRGSGGRMVFLIECKSGAGDLSAADLKSFGTKLSHYGFAHGVIVSNRHLSKSAEEQARKLGVQVFSPDDVPRFIESLSEASDE